MIAMDATLRTTRAHRLIRADEAALVRWMLCHASLTGPLAHLLAEIARLKVVDHCRCGCRSVLFGPSILPGRREPIASAIGYTPVGAAVGVVLWGTRESVSALEFTGQVEDLGDSLPVQESLRPNLLN